MSIGYARRVGSLSTAQRLVQGERRFDHARVWPDRSVIAVGGSDAQQRVGGGKDRTGVSRHPDIGSDAVTQMARSLMLHTPQYAGRPATDAVALAWRAWVPSSCACCANATGPAKETAQDCTSLPASICLIDGKPSLREARTDTVHDRFRIEHGCTGLCARYAWIVLEQIA